MHGPSTARALELDGVHLIEYIVSHERRLRHVLQRGRDPDDRPGRSDRAGAAAVRPTYARRKAQSPTGRLSKAESTRLVRFVRIWEMALRVWKDEDAARAFLQRPHMLLDGRTPLAVVLSGEVGGQLVEDILGRLLYGTGV